MVLHLYVCCWENLLAFWIEKWKKCNWFPKGQRHLKLQSGPSRVWGPGLSPDHFGCPRIWPERNPTRGLARLKIQNISGWTFKEPRQHGPILIDFWRHFSFDLGKLDQIILWLFAKLLRSIVYMLYLSIRHDTPWWNNDPHCSVAAW